MNKCEDCGYSCVCKNTWKRLRTAKCNLYKEEVIGDCFKSVEEVAKSLANSPDPDDIFIKTLRESKERKPFMSEFDNKKFNKDAEELRKEFNELEQIRQNGVMADIASKYPTIDFVKTVKPKRKVILEDAASHICGDRQDEYGSPKDNFKKIAESWSWYLGAAHKVDVDISAEDVAHMMTLLKITRIATGKPKLDSFVDAAGYIALAGEIAEKKI